MTVSTRSPRTLSVCSAALAVLVVACAAPALAGERFLPQSPHVDKPLYAASRTGLEHYIQDNLGKLIAGQTWDWNGHHFEGIRLHHINKAWATHRSRQANRDYDSGLRGWAAVRIHVKVDGVVTAARVEVNASYVWQPGGWAWEQVLVYLGNGDAYDFASKRIR